MIWAFPQAEHTVALVPRALEIYEEYVKDGLTAKELDFSKKAQTNSYPFKFASSRARLQARLYELLEGAPARSVPEYRKIVNGVTRASLLAAIKKVHDPKNVAIVMVGDPARTGAVIGKLKEVTVVRITDPMAALP